MARRIHSLGIEIAIPPVFAATARICGERGIKLSPVKSSPNLHLHYEYYDNMLVEMTIMILRTFNY